QRLVALESGAIDIAHSVLPEESQFVELHPRLTLHRTAPSSITYLALNGDKAPFDDGRVRRAVNHAINKVPIVKVLWQGLASPAGSPLAPSGWGHWAGPDYDYDPDRARVLLAQAAAEGRFDPSRVYRLYVPATSRPHLPNPERLGRAIQANLRDVGIDVEMVALPLPDFLRAVRDGEHDMCIHGWVPDHGDPDNTLYVLFSRRNAELGRATNLSFYRDPEVQGLLVVAQESAERSEREALYARVQALIHEHAPWVPLAHSRVAVASRDELRGVRMLPTGVIHYREVSRRDWRRSGRTESRADGR
ncbi:MAG: ABC transporter substrate-binding protein, partial [Myxococcota bacterium]